MIEREMSPVTITPGTGGEGELICGHLPKMLLATKSKIIKSTKSHLSKHDWPKSKENISTCQAQENLEADKSSLENKRES